MNFCLDAQLEIQILNGLYYRCLKSCDFIWTIYFESKINSKGGNFVTAEQKKFDLLEYLNHNKKIVQFINDFWIASFSFCFRQFQFKRNGRKSCIVLQIESSLMSWSLGTTCGQKSSIVNRASYTTILDKVTVNMSCGDLFLYWYNVRHTCLGQHRCVFWKNKSWKQNSSWITTRRYFISPSISFPGKKLDFEKTKVT